jgi:hypothetical protein
MSKHQDFLFDFAEDMQQLLTLKWASKIEYIPYTEDMAQMKNISGVTKVCSSCKGCQTDSCSLPLVLYT